MGDSKQKKRAFSDALLGKNIPVLTLDHKWYRLLDEFGKKEAQSLSDQLNELLKRQGKINTESKEIRKLKKKLMNEIVPMVNEAEETGDKKIEKKIDQHKRLIEDCNEKLEAYQDELKEIPGEIDRVNRQLMLFTMESCYKTMQQNSAEIKVIDDWVTDIRIELKKRLVEKQEMEQKNQQIYTYMHDVFGAEVLNLFDMTYNPENHKPKSSKGEDPN